MQSERSAAHWRFSICQTPYDPRTVRQRATEDRETQRIQTEILMSLHFRFHSGGEWKGIHLILKFYGPRFSEFIAVAVLSENISASLCLSVGL